MTSNKKDEMEENQCIFYNSPFCWSDILMKDSLKVLIIIGQTLQTLEGVGLLFNLNELWVVECSLTNATDIIKCINLMKLYLYNNELTEIPEVNRLKKLQTLWLSGNNISLITNMNESNELRELQLADNNITKIGDVFMDCDKLEYLNLSGNPIKNVLVILDLKPLPSLKTLLFHDPLHRTTPITKFVNYRSFIIHKILQLISLDGFQVHADERANVADYFNPKILHYSMEYHSKLYSYIKKLTDKNEINNKKMNDLMEQMYYTTMMQKMAIYKPIGLKKAIHKEFEMLLETINVWEFENQINETWLDKIQHDLQIRNQLLQIEQRFFGNVKFVDLDRNEEIIIMLQNCLQCFVCPFIKSYLIDNIKVDHVLQVIDRRNLLERLNILKAITNNKEVPNFLILKNPVGIENSVNWNPAYFCAHFESKKYDIHKYSLTNSIAIADHSWLNHMSTCWRNAPSEKINSRRILILVYTAENIFSTDTFNQHASPLKENQKNCDCCQLHIADEYSLVVPAFIIEYHYIYKQLHGEELISCRSELEKKNTSLDMLNMLMSLTQVEYKCVETSSCFEIQTWQHLTNLILSKSFIKSFGTLTILPNVTFLDVSYNKIEYLNEISTIFPKLFTLIISFNEIKSVKSLLEMKHLKELDLSSNQIQSFINTLTWLKKTAKSVKKLKIKFNPFVDVQSVKHIPHIAKLCFPSLNYFNDKDLNSKENSAIQINLATLHRNDLLLYEFPIDKSLERKTQLIWNRDTCTEFTETDGIIEETENHITVNCEKQPICLYIRKYEQPIRNVTIKFDTSKLRYLTITHTYLNSLVVPETACNLEELDLSFNMMAILHRNFLRSQCLVRINLMGNYLGRLDILKEVNLPCLKYLNLSKNFLCSLYGIESFVTIEELYVASNQIMDWNELRFIKKFNNLKVIDTRDNPLDNKTFRKFLVFHLNNLMFIDGNEVLETELDDAHILFGGILDEDYLIKEYTLKNLKKLTELSLSNSSFKQVCMPPLENITSVNLENNNLTNFSGLAYLKNLKCLCLSNNQISTFGDGSEELSNPIYFNNLEILYLNLNNIVNLEHLELYRAPKLVSLFLQDNELVFVQGLNKLDKLKHLVLDRNKISLINPKDLTGLINLKNLYIEYNLIQNLQFLKELKSLKCLFLAHNKITRYRTLQNLSYLSKVKELTIHGNPMCRYCNNYIALLTFLPRLNLLDGFQLDRSKFQL